MSAQPERGTRPFGVVSPPAAVDVTPHDDAVADELAALDVVMRTMQGLVDANNRGAAIRVWQHVGQWLQVPVGDPQ